MTNSEFCNELNARIAKYDLLCHPFYKAWSAGELTREDLRDYAADYFHHVNAFPEYLREAAARLPQGELRRAVLANRDDEMGVHGSRPHAELWLDFLEGMGGGRIVSEKPVQEISRLTEWFHDVARRGNSEEALAVFYAYESQVPRIATEKARGLREMYGADAKTCEYFTLHATADVYHSRVWKGRLEDAVENNPGAAERALNAAEAAAQNLWRALDGQNERRLSRRQTADA